MESYHPPPSRRTFLAMAWGTVAVVVTPVSALGWRREDRATHAWGPRAGQAKYRIDGMSKVLGRKIYARDMRSRDMNGWPDTERAALVLYASCVDRPFEGLDLSALPDALQPSVVVDAARIAKDGVAVLSSDTAPKGWTAGFFVQKDVPPGYFGQPIAILIFKDARTLRAARRLIQFDSAVVRYGEAVTPQPAEGIYKSGTYLTYLEGQFSQTDQGHSNPYEADPSPADTRAKEVRSEIRATAKDPAWTAFSGYRTTQRIAPMFMEPESGLGWLDGKTLHLALGTQSPNGDVSDGLLLFGGSSFTIDEVQLVSCYPGGGFGGRDVSPFSPTLMLAAVYADGPVRISHDRFTQFHTGLTQLPAQVKQTFYVDKDHRFQALETESVLPAGGRNNYSQYVAGLAGYSAGGAYYFPRAIVDASAKPTHQLVAGSMRGFGGVQAAFAMETVVDSIARELDVDAIELRRKNALDNSMRTVTGAPMTEPAQISEICDRALGNPIWKDRAKRKASAEKDGRLYGVGFALANQAFGVGNDGVLASVAIQGDGAIVVKTTAVDMGNGSATSLALAPSKYLGSNATSIDMGCVSVFNALQLTDHQPKKQNVKGQFGHSPSAWDKNPRYTGHTALSSSACITAFQQFHGVEEAAYALFAYGVWPAAVALWGKDPGERARDSAEWKDGELGVAGFPSLSWGAIVEKIHSGSMTSEAIVHAFYSGRWVRSKFSVDGSIIARPIDALATRAANQEGYRLYDRFDVEPPPDNSGNYGRSLYSPSGTLAALSVDPKSGEVRLEEIYTYLDAGKIHQEDLVIGHYPGGVAMGVGYALLEDMPPGPGGPGGGQWNLNRYQVPRAGDLPLKNIQLEFIPPVGPDPKAKGIAEAVLCPVPPAIANAIADATGHEFESLPITPKQIRKALRP